MDDEQLIFEKIAEYLAQALHDRLPRTRSLYEALRRLIHEEAFQTGTALPASRKLATQLGLSRNTVLAALDQLHAEGYVENQAARGVYVHAQTLPKAVPTQWTSPKSAEPQVAQRGLVLSMIGRAPPIRGAFAPGIPDLSAFPYEKWQRYCNRYGSNPKLDWLNYSNQGGLPALRQAIAAHIRLSRSINCAAEQIIVTSGTQQSLLLCALLLSNPGDTAYMEDPGYPGARAALTAAGLNVRGQKIDVQGMVLPGKSQSSPKLAYLTPSHQYPLGLVMSLERRNQWISYAQTRRCWLLEDDYDSEFRYGGAPLAALCALTRLQQSIYFGTFSKTLFPALHLAYFVLPEELIEPAQQIQARYFREPAYTQQAALAAFIADGHLARHIRQMRTIYQARRDAFYEYWEKTFGATLPLQGGAAGMHLSLNLPAHISDQEIELQLLSQGIAVRALSRYNIKQHSNGLLFGYGDVSLDNLRKMLPRVAQVIQAAR